MHFAHGEHERENTYRFGNISYTISPARIAPLRKAQAEIRQYGLGAPSKPGTPGYQALARQGRAAIAGDENSAQLVAGAYRATRNDKAAAVWDYIALNGEDAGWAARRSGMGKELYNSFADTVEGAQRGAISLFGGPVLGPLLTRHAPVYEIERKIILPEEQTGATTVTAASIASIPFGGGPLAAVKAGNVGSKAPLVLSRLNAAEGAAAGGAPLASSIFGAPRLRSQLLAEEVANGHALGKHVADGEFAGLGIRTKPQFQDFIEGIVGNPATPKRYATDGTVFYLDDATRTVVISGQRGEATAFRPDFGVGWDNYLKTGVPKNVHGPGFDPAPGGR